jgi:hypothetical protein
LSKYTTNSVPENTKKHLEVAKGKRKRSKLLMALYDEYALHKSRTAFEEAAHFGGPS